MALIIEDLCQVERPALTVLTPSLNHGRFLRGMLESVISQSYRNFEHIVIDGGSTDETVKTLKEYPHLRWISEPDGSMVEAYQKGLAMARGDYVIQCCVSDGFLDKHWFQKSVDILEKDDEVSLVWGFPQYMSEEGDLLNVSFQEFFTDPPPQKEGFLAFWLATGFPFPEGNYCVRSSVIKELFPSDRSEEYFQIHSHLGFVYNFMTRGYCPYFIPVVANFGRIHADQRSRRLKGVEEPAERMYFRRVKDYRTQVLKQEVTHAFRNGRGQVFRELTPTVLSRLRAQIWRHRILQSKLLRRDPYTLLQKITQRLAGDDRDA